MTPDKQFNTGPNVRQARRELERAAKAGASKVDPVVDLRQVRASLARTNERLRELDARLAAMPNQPKTPLHSFRVDTELWNAAKERAKERGESLGEALRKFLERYTR